MIQNGEIMIFVDDEEFIDPFGTRKPCRYHSVKEALAEIEKFEGAKSLQHKWEIRMVGPLDVTEIHPVLLFLDEVGPIPDMLPIVMAPDTQNLAGNLAHDDRFELTEGPVYNTADYCPTDELYLPSQEPFCHHCNRRHNQNYCVRKGRSKNFKTHGRRVNR